MTKVKEYCGIDVSMDTLDVVIDELGHKVFENNPKGYQSLLKWSGKGVHFVMECTGVYHEQLAHFLYANEQEVSVVNPLIIKRYSQMLLRSVKTDKADAEMICSYAKNNRAQLKLWKPLPSHISSCKDINGIVRLLIKQRTALKNKRHSLKHKGAVGNRLLSSVDKSIKSVDRQIGEMEKMMEELVVEHETVLYNQLKTIPGIGTKTAIFLIVVCNGFRDFENSKQVSSYLGLSPSIRSSGSSVRGKSRITKTGNNQLRSLLFLSSFSAYKYNPACKALFDRITEKGKSKKLALIAVANKLLKQAFALSKSGKMFEMNYVSVNPGLALK